ncbi:MAG: 16S rRNA (guanine(527)-N(7))-methyltransferase RsmG [bacterium]|nr:16S rRNA (guanine(527)-N(7))-methyltransferase RsmG [bacterium]
MTISPDLEKRLHELCTCFLEENAKLNLSAFRTEENCWVGNVLDSVAAIDLELFAGAKNIADIGTGGGFPLLPLALLMPETKFTGIDSTQKKIDAIGRICDAMDIQNIQLLSGRLEDIGRDSAFREQFDVVTARAVAPLNTLLEYASPLVKMRGHILCWKSMTIDQELKDSLLARAELSCTLEKGYEYELPGDWGKRQILVLSKRGKIGKKYPREVGIPKKTPLL